MFTQLDDALNVLLARKNQTFGNDNLRKCFEVLGNPQFDLTCIHIGGTNGKGSTTNFTRSFLNAAGYRVGTFTSPHLVTHTDRIRIDNIPIPDDLFLKYVNETYPLWDAYSLSMFEIDMLISVLYFNANQVDYVVYEVGLGGRLDATNVIMPRVSGITNIGLDHQKILGDTLVEIAGEKAGIIKPQRPLLTTETNPLCLNVFQEVCHDVGAPFIHVIEPKISIQNEAVQFEVGGTAYYLHGEPLYQAINATLAMRLVAEVGVVLTAEQRQRALDHTKWAGRFEEVCDRVVIDGAHNELGIERLIESLPLLKPPYTIIFTALNDKPIHTMIEQLQKVADTVIVTSFEFGSRGMSADELRNGHDVIAIADYREAIEYGLSHRGMGTLIITGSLYFISTVRERLIKKTTAE